MYFQLFPREGGKRLVSDLLFSHYELRYDFKKGLAHGMKPVAIQPVPIGTPKKKPDRDHEKDRTIYGNLSGGKGTTGHNNLSPRLWELQREKGHMQWLKDCKQCHKEEKCAFWKKIEVDKS